MRTELVWLVGAGGHCLVVLDALFRSGQARDRIRILDENKARIGASLLGIAINDLDAAPDFDGGAFHVTIGANAIRAAMFERLQRNGSMPCTVKHPDATVSESASIGAGSFVAARAIVGPMAAVGDGAIVNHAAVIDHECQVGEFCHVAPGTTLAGRVRIGARVLLGAGARVLPGITIGEEATIGAGAVVTRDVPPRTTYVGVPARRIC